MFTVDAAQWMLDQAVAALTDASISVPSFQYLAFRQHETVVHDRCCEGGQLVASVAEVYPVVEFPNPQQGLARCTNGYAVLAAVELVRCAETGDQTNGMPTPSAMDTEGTSMLDEGAVLACHFVGALGGTYDGFITGVEGSVAGGCRSVVLTATLYVP